MYVFMQGRRYSSHDQGVRVVPLATTSNGTDSLGAWTARYMVVTLGDLPATTFATLSLVTYDLHQFVLFRQVSLSFLHYITLY